MKYKFEQFKVEIVDPIIEVDLNSIHDKAIDKILSVDVYLTSSFGRFGLDTDFVKIPYNDSWDDEDVYGMVVEWLKQFEI